jgi:hypothetical protein
MSDAKSKIIKSKTPGFNYSYVSLADIANEDFIIPQMKVEPEFNAVTGEFISDYIWAKMGDEWIRGARIVIPRMNGSNEAQMYGAALTYARRVTALMMLQLVSEDDKDLESPPQGPVYVADESQQPARPQYQQKGGNHLDFDTLRAQLANLATPDEVKDHVAKKLNECNLTMKQIAAVKKIEQSRLTELTKGGSR